MTAHDPMTAIRRVLERERFCKDVGDGALSEMILSVAEPLMRADERERLRAQVPQLPLWGTGLVRVSDVLALLGGESDG